MKKYFTTKLLCLYALAIVLFTMGTIRYQNSKYYKHDQYEVLYKEMRKNMALSQRYVDSSICAFNRDDEVHVEFYMVKAINYYHISDSIMNELPKYK